MKLQDHLHSTQFKKELLQQYELFYKKIADAEEKTNENDADSQEQIRQLTSNENMIGYRQLTMHNLIVIKKNYLTKSGIHQKIER